MIGVSVSLGIGLFLKFVQYDLNWDTLLVAFGYLCISATGMYENRTFILDDMVKIENGVLVDAGIRHHRMTNNELFDCTEAELILEDKTNEIYSGYHVAGVSTFILSFIGISHKYWNGDGSYARKTHGILNLSLIGLILGALCFLYNHLLTRTSINFCNGRTRHQCNRIKVYPSSTAGNSIFEFPGVLELPGA